MGCRSLRGNSRCAPWFDKVLLNPVILALFFDSFCLTDPLFCILISIDVPREGRDWMDAQEIFQVGDQAPIGRQEFHAEVAKLHSRLDRLNSRLHTLSEERISRLEAEVGDIKRLLERCLNSTSPVWNKGVEHPGPVVPS